MTDLFTDAHPERWASASTNSNYGKKCLSSNHASTRQHSSPAPIGNQREEGALNEYRRTNEWRESCLSNERHIHGLRITLTR